MKGNASKAWQLTLTNVKTGEVITDETAKELLTAQIVFKDAKKRAQQKNELKKLGIGEYMMAIQPTMRKAPGDCTNDELKVLFILMGSLDFDNYIKIRQEEIATLAKIHHTNVSKALKGLVDKGYIDKYEFAKNDKYYKLKPNVGFKGSLENHLKLLVNDKTT